MAWVAIDKNGDEVIFDFKPYRRNDFFQAKDFGDDIYLPKAPSRNLQAETLHGKMMQLNLKKNSYART